MKFTPLNIASVDSANAENIISTYDVSGSDVTVLVIDEGRVRDTHQEFKNDANQTRVTIHSNSSSESYNNHATHVAGTIGARGVVPNAKGFAPNVNILSMYFGASNIFSDTYSNSIWYQERNNFQISNHSYGPFSNYYINSSFKTDSNVIKLITCFYNWNDYKANYNVNKPEFNIFGKYTSTSRQHDINFYQAKQNLSIWAAGNDNESSVISNLGTVDVGGQTFTNPISLRVPSSTQPITSADLRNLVDVGNFFQITDGTENYLIPKTIENPTDFDVLLSTACNKNGITVGSHNDLTNDPITNMPSTSSFSSRGPTDDGRIKPEILANGEFLYSPISTGDDQYDSYPGTSMAAPSVSGAAALIYQYYRKITQLPNLQINSATLKALILGSAYHNNQPPSYVYGYGILDVNACFDFLTKWDNTNINNTNYKNIIEDTLQSHTKKEIIFTPKSTTDKVKIFLCWTDYTDSNSILSPSGIIDDPTSVIMNKLKIKVVNDQNTYYYPWYLNVNDPTAIARNSVETGLFDTTYGTIAPYDNTKCIEFSPINTNEHKIIIESDTIPLLTNSIGQDFSIYLDNGTLNSSYSISSSSIYIMGSIANDISFHTIRSTSYPQLDDSILTIRYTTPIHNDIFDVSSIIQPTTSTQVKGNQHVTRNGNTTNIDFSASNTSLFSSIPSNSNEFSDISFVVKTKTISGSDTFSDVSTVLFPKTNLYDVPTDLSFLRCVSGNHLQTNATKNNDLDAFKQEESYAYLRHLVVDLSGSKTNGVLSSSTFEPTSSWITDICYSTLSSPNVNTPSDWKSFDLSSTITGQGVNNNIKTVGLTISGDTLYDATSLHLKPIFKGVGTGITDLSLSTSLDYSKYIGNIPKLTQTSFYDVCANRTPKDLSCTIIPSAKVIYVKVESGKFKLYRSNTYSEDSYIQPNDLKFESGVEYIFDQTDSTNATNGTHPIIFTSTSSRTSSSTTIRRGTPGSYGAYSIQTFTAGQTYYMNCAMHDDMGSLYNVHDSKLKILSVNEYDISNSYPNIDTSYITVFPAGNKYTDGTYGYNITAPVSFRYDFDRLKTNLDGTNSGIEISGNVKVDATNSKFNIHYNPANKYVDISYVPTTVEHDIKIENVYVRNNSVGISSEYFPDIKIPKSMFVLVPDGSANVFGDVNDLSYVVTKTKLNEQGSLVDIRTLPTPNYSSNNLYLHGDASTNYVELSFNVAFKDTTKEKWIKKVEWKSSSMSNWQDVSNLTISSSNKKTIAFEISGSELKDKNVLIRPTFNLYNAPISDISFVLDWKDYVFIVNKINYQWYSYETSSYLSENQALPDTSFVTLTKSDYSQTANNNMKFKLTCDANTTKFNSPGHSLYQDISCIVKKDSTVIAELTQANDSKYIISDSQIDISYQIPEMTQESDNSNYTFEIKGKREGESLFTSIGNDVTIDKTRLYDLPTDLSFISSKNDTIAIVTDATDKDMFDQCYNNVYGYTVLTVDLSDTFTGFRSDDESHWITDVCYCLIKDKEYVEHGVNDVSWNKATSYIKTDGVTNQVYKGLDISLSNLDLYDASCLNLKLHLKTPGTNVGDVSFVYRDLSMNLSNVPYLKKIEYVYGDTTLIPSTKTIYESSNKLWTKFEDSKIKLYTNSAKTDLVDASCFYMKKNEWYAFENDGSHKVGIGNADGQTITHCDTDNTIAGWNLVKVTSSNAAPYFLNSSNAGFTGVLYNNGVHGFDVITDKIDICSNKIALHPVNYPMKFRYTFDRIKGNEDSFNGSGHLVLSGKTKNHGTNVYSLVSTDFVNEQVYSVDVSCVATSRDFDLSLVDFSLNNSKGKGLNLNTGVLPILVLPKGQLEEYPTTTPSTDALNASSLYMRNWQPPTNNSALYVISHLSFKISSPSMYEGNIEQWSFEGHNGSSWVQIYNTTNALTAGGSYTTNTSLNTTAYIKYRMKATSISVQSSFRMYELKLYTASNQEIPRSDLIDASKYEFKWVRYSDLSYTTYTTNNSEVNVDESQLTNVGSFNNGYWNSNANDTQYTTLELRKL